MKLLRLRVHCIKTSVIERIRQYYDMGHVRSSTRDNIDQAIQAACKNGKVKNNGAFIWILDEQLHRAPRLPVDGNIEHIPPTELKTIIITIVKAMLGIPQSDLMVDVARRLGFNRTGGRITEILNDIIRELLNQGKLIESFGMVRVPENESKIGFKGESHPTTERKGDTAQHKAEAHHVAKTGNKDTEKDSYDSTTKDKKQGNLVFEKDMGATLKPNVFNQPPEFYEKMAQWGKKTGLLTNNELNDIFSIINVVRNRWPFPKHLQPLTIELIEKAKKLGFK